MVRPALFVVSLHMTRDGNGAFPSQETIAMRAGVGVRSVKRYLAASEAQEWLTRRKVRRTGKAWRRTGYEAVVPNEVHAMLLDRQRAPSAGRGAIGDKVVVPKLGLLTLTPNSPMNSAYNEHESPNNIDKPTSEAERFIEKEVSDRRRQSKPNCGLSPLRAWWRVT
jgi:hypothetical protein